MDGMCASDEQLWQACRKLPSDWEPHGQRRWYGRREDRPDCATCFFYMELFRAWPDWGVCGNPDSPRGGLLTYWEQGCWQFEADRGQRHEGTRRAHCEFRNNVENVLREMAGDFVREEVRKANDPVPDEGSSVPGAQHLCWETLRITLGRLLRHAKEDTRPEVLDALASRAKRESSRYWEFGRRYLARTVGEDVASIRLPVNMRELENEFWRRVEATIHEAIEGRSPEPNERTQER